MPAPTTILAFDLDGVLIDARLSYPQAIIQTVAALGGGRVRRQDMQLLKDAGGFNNDWLLSRELLRRAGHPCSLSRIRAVFDRLYLGPPGRAGLRLNEKWLLPPAALRRLRRRHRLALFTGRPRAHARWALRHFGVLQWFDALIALEDVRRAKPHPEGLRLLQQRLGPARLCAYAGDLVDDARCAAAAAIPFVGVSPNRKRLLRAAGAALVVSHITDAVPWLEALG